MIDTLKILSILFLPHSLNMEITDHILCDCIYFLLMSHDTNCIYLIEYPHCAVLRVCDVMGGVRLLVFVTVREKNERNMSKCG